MSRQEKWWENEQSTGPMLKQASGNFGPIHAILIGNIAIQHYPKSGVLHIGRWTDNGRFKGINDRATIHLDQLSPQDRENLKSTLCQAIDNESKYDPETVLLMDQTVIQPGDRSDAFATYQTVRIPTTKPLDKKAACAAFNRQARACPTGQITYTLVGVESSAVIAEMRIPAAE